MNLTISKFDASFDFKQAFVKNVEKNGLENVMTQFKALANIYAPDFYIDVTAISTQESQNAN
jgi:hypothetical protein